MTMSGPMCTDCVGRRGQNEHGPLPPVIRVGGTRIHIIVSGHYRVSGPNLTLCVRERSFNNSAMKLRSAANSGSSLRRNLRTKPTCTVTHWRNWKEGETDSRVETLFKIAAGLEMPLSELIAAVERRAAA